jgi:membrane-associated phospholipid phosphatase
VTSALRPRVESYSRRGVAFVLRHRWSLPLSLASSVSLAYLARQMRAGDLAGVDAVAARVVHGWRGSMDGLMFALTATGGGLGMTFVSLATILALARARRRRATMFMTLAALGTLLLVSGLKLLFQRARPDIAYMIQTPASFSFPSGHALGSMGVMGSLVVVLYAMRVPKPVCRLATLLVALFVLGVALSRVYFGVHYPSDVIGGVLAAAAWVSGLTGWFYPHLFPGERTLEPAPQPPP